MNDVHISGNIISFGNNPKNEEAIGMIINDWQSKSAFQANFIGSDAETIRSKFMPGDYVSLSGYIAGIQLNPKGNLILVYNPKLLSAKRPTHEEINLLEGSE